MVQNIYGAPMLLDAAVEPPQTADMGGRPFLPLLCARAILKFPCHAYAELLRGETLA